MQWSRWGLGLGPGHRPPVVDSWFGGWGRGPVDACPLGLLDEHPDLPVFADPVESVLPEVLVPSLHLQGHQQFQVPEGTCVLCRDDSRRGAGPVTATSCSRLCVPHSTGLPCVDYDLGTQDPYYDRGGSLPTRDRGSRGCDGIDGGGPEGHP